MSGFFSLLPDLLPMILPSEVQITKASDLEAQRGGKDAPMIRQGAVIGKSDRMCATGKLPIYLPVQLLPFCTYTVRPVGCHYRQ